MNIRKTTLFDLPVLWDLWLALTAEERANEIVAGRDTYPVVSLDDKEPWSIEFCMLIANPNVLVLLAGDNSCAASGFMVSSIQTRQVGHPKVYAQVHQLYVRPGDRSKAGGEAAKLLCTTAEEWVRAQGVKHVEIDCVESNRPLWENRGFTLAAHRMFRELK